MIAAGGTVGDQIGPGSAGTGYGGIIACGAGLRQLSDRPKPCLASGGTCCAG